MRLLALVGLVGLLSGCGVGTGEEAGSLEQAPVSEETNQLGPPEYWCRSYTSQRFCPSVCAWYSTPAPGYCSLKPESAEMEAEAERTQQSPPEAWCRSYKSQQFCPRVCVWYSTPAPGYCGLPATE